MKKTKLQLGCVLMIGLAIVMLMVQFVVGRGQSKVYTIEMLLDLLALIAIAGYTIRGGSKKQRWWYMGALLLKAASFFLAIISVGLEGYTSHWPPVWNLGYNAVCLSALTVLIFAPDLGRKKSYLITTILLVLPVVDFIAGFNYGTGFKRDQLLFIGAIDLSDLIFAATVFMAVAIKYADKEERYSLKDE